MSTPTIADVSALLAQISPWTEIRCTPEGWTVRQKVKVAFATEHAIVSALKPFASLIGRGLVRVTASAQDSRRGLLIEIEQIEPSAWPGSQSQVEGIEP